MLQGVSMNAPVVLAATYHDPDGSMLAQAQRVAPVLQRLYDAVVLLATPETSRRALDGLHALEVEAEVQRSYQGDGIATLGVVRRDSLDLALRWGASYIHLCDWDRLLHWAEFHPDELCEVVAAIPSYDFLIMGRTTQAFSSHPRVQRDTETLINHVFGLSWGQPLDITAGARGLSRRAARALIDLPDPEPTAGNDGAWPLYLARDPELVIGYAATDGLEWETPDRHADAIAAAGGLDAWIAAYDADPQRWAFRTRLAAYEIEAIARWRLASDVIE
jgi:hypothetical protein